MEERKEKRNTRAVQLRSARDRKKKKDCFPTRVRSDKDRTGTITIVPVRTGTVILEKYRKL